MSGTDDAYAPEEPTPDISMSLLDIQMPETPESTKGQASDGDTCRLESPRLLKPVLGKVQAKKRLMAFANKFNVLPKIRNKSMQAINATKDDLGDESNTNNTKTQIKMEHSQQPYNRYSSGNKLRKKTEEKILAIEEIRREESKSKLLLAEAIAAASLEEENLNKNNSTSWDTSKNLKERCNQNETISFQKSSNKSVIERKRKQHKEEKEENTSREVKERHENKERYKSPQNREQHKKDRERKDDKSKRDDVKVELNRDKKDDGRDKRENQKDKRDEIRERKEGSKDRREKQNDFKEGVADVKEKKDKDKFKDKEREMIKYESWTELRNSGVTLDDVIQLRRQENLERPMKNRTLQDYTRYLDQMLMLNNCHLKRSALIIEGLNGPKEFPPESIRFTKRGRQLIYCENPRVSLLLNRQQLFQAVTIDRREKLRDICDATSTRSDLEENEEPLCTRNWYKKVNMIEPANKIKWQLSTNVQLPKSKWDSEDEEITQENDETKNQGEQMETENIVEKQEKVSTSCNSHDENSSNIENADNQNDSDSKKCEIVDKTSSSPVVQPAGNEKLASEYEQFMKMVCTDIPLPDTVNPAQEFTSEKCLLQPVSLSNYHEFNIEVTSSEDKCNTYSDTKSTVCENQNKITSEVLSEKNIHEKECLENPCVTFEHSEHSILSVSSQTPVQESENTFENTTICREKEESQSIPSDWENVRIKVECLSDENSEPRKEKRRRKHVKKKTSSSSESSSSSSSSDSEDKKSKRKRKRKLSQDSSSSDSDSSESSSTSSSSESLSSDSKRKKKKRKKRKIGKRKKKAKRIARIKKRRRRKISSPSSSSESDERRKRRKVMKKKLKSRKILSEKELNNAEIVSELSDSTAKHTLQNKLVSMQSSSKKIKEEIDIKGQGEKHNLWEKVDTLSTREMDVNINSKSIINKENQDKTTKKFLEEWEVDSVLIAKQLDSEMLKDDEQNKVQRMDRRDKNVVTNEQMKEKQCNENFLEEKQKIENELEEKKKRKKDKEKKINTEFLAEWERESERIARQIIQDDLKFSKKLEKHKKEKWGETEFDTLNVPSLTQLENEVSKGQLLADEWEVDSLEAIADLAATKRRSSRNSTKKLEKEVKYDKKTDTYIAVDKESARENRKRIERLCTIRIWEDEEEEGEREAMMLVQEKNKRKKDEWDIEEESFMRGSEKGKDSIDTSSVASATSATTTIVSDITDIAVNVQPDLSISYIQNSADRSNVELLDKLKENEFAINKKTKKSRWDIGSQSDEKMELKASVMWEEECAEWSNITKPEHKLSRTSSDKPEKILLKNKVKDDICHVTNQPLNIEKSSSKYSENSANFLKRKQSCTLKLEDNELLEQSWSENSNIDTIIDKVSIINKKNPSTERLKTILDIDTRLGQRNMELYSPSSPAPSQKSEDIEASSGSNSTSFNKSRLHQDKNEELCKMEEQLISSSSIPLQLKKFHENICTPSHIQNVGTYSKVEKCNKMDAENSEKLLSSLHSDSSSDVHPSKSLQMDMFAEYETERSYNNENIKHINTTTETSTKNDETNEGKTSFKLIPKQFLIRRSNEHEKSKKIEVSLQDPAQQIAALLTIQKKLLQSRMLDSDKKDKEFSVAASTCTTNADKILNANIASTDECSSTDLAVTVTNVKLGSTEEVLKESQLQDTTHSKLPTSDMLYPGHSKEYNVQDTKKGESTKTSKVSIIADNSDTDIQQSIKSSSKEQKRRSPIKKEDNKRYNDRNKNKRDRKIDDRDRIDRRDYKSSRMEYNENKRKMSPMRNKRRLIDSPCSSWEREESASGSHSRSWSRSRSKSPRRRDETIVYTRDRDRKLNKNTDHRSIRARDVDNRKERFIRSPERSATTSYNKTNRNNRDEWNKKKYGNIDRDQEREIKPYNPLEILRERNMDSNKYSENRVQVEEETDQTFWQFEVGNPLRDGESLDSFGNHQDLNVGYNKSYYRDESLEREIMEGPISSMSKSRQSKRDRLKTRRNQQWVEGGDTTDLERYAHSIRRVEKIPPRRSRLSPSLRHSPSRSSTDRFRRVSRSRSRSWSRSRSRSRSRTKSRSRSRSRSSSRSRSRSKLPSRSRSRSRSTSRTRLRKRSPEHDLRMSENLHTSRSPSLLRDRISGNVRERKEENDNRNNAEETGRRIETIVQSASSVTRVTADSTVMDSEMQINSSTDNVPSNFQYSGVNESSNDYYYTENNLTYPPCIDESATSSPKRLSLDDRLELELGIKKQHEQETNVLSDYSNSFNPNNVVYPSPPPQQQQQLYRRQPTVLQVGNVLQVVPADYNGISPARTEVPAITTPPIVRGSSQVVRVGNVLQVVPTSLDWSSATSSTVDQPGTTLYSAIPSTSPVPVPISVPIPVPVPMPVPAIPSVSSTPIPSSTLSPVPLPLSVPVPTPVPIPIPTTTYPRSEITVQKISAQPVYNYEAILESRRKEREERKRLREMRRKEKERRRIERVNRRALRLLEKKTIGAPQSENATLLDRRKIPPAIDHSVIKALHDGDEEATSENQPEKEQENSPSLTTSIEEEDAPGDDDEDDEEEEAEGEDEDDDYEDPEDDEEEEELDDQKSIARVENRKEETGEVETSISDVNQAESKLKDWPLLPIAPLKGILISPGFRKDTISNGNIDNLPTADEDNEDYIDKEEPGLETISDVNKGDNTCESKINLTKHKVKLRTKISHKHKRAKKSVQFADGIKPGEGTSPSGGEGDMPSPPPPSSMTSQDSPCDLKRSLSKRIKKEKRARHPKTKKKVKVKIIKLKKPRVTPLSAMMTEDSDELDDLPPPPPPPGSPPPPHLWPSYLSACSGTVKAAEIQSIIVPTPTPVQAPPPPTPLPLLIPPPPLNYTIQPCTKA